MRRLAVNRAIAAWPGQVACLAGAALAAVLPLPHSLAGTGTGDVRAEVEVARPVDQPEDTTATGAHVPPVKRVQPVTPPPAVPSAVPLPLRKPEDLANATSKPRKN